MTCRRRLSCNESRRAQKVSLRLYPAGTDPYQPCYSPSPSHRGAAAGDRRRQYITDEHGRRPDRPVADGKTRVMSQEVSVRMGSRRFVRRATPARRTPASSSTGGRASGDTAHPLRRLGPSTSWSSRLGPPAGCRRGSACALQDQRPRRRRAPLHNGSRHGARSPVRRARRPARRTFDQAVRSRRARTWLARNARCSASRGGCVRLNAARGCASPGHVPSVGVGPGRTERM